MILIVEGPRGSGKTTIAQGVVKTLQDRGIDAEYAKFKRTDTPILDMLLTVKEFSAQPQKVFVIDRFHLTEWVMRKFDGKYYNMGKLDAHIELVDMMLSDANAAIAYVGAEGYTREQRVAIRNDGRGMDMPTEDADRLWSRANRKFWIDYYVDNELRGDTQRAIDFLVRVTTNALEE